MSEEIEQSFYEDNEFKSKRFPDLHGGQKDAAASPDERDSKKGIDEARSEVAIRHRADQSRKALHGEHEPRASLPVLVNILNTEIEQLKALKSIQDLLEFQIPLGQTYAFQIAFPTGSNFTHIEFADSNSTFGLPSGTFVNHPNRKLAKLKIYNDGPGTIKFSSNMPMSQRTAEIQLNAGEFDDSLSFNYSIIFSLNIAVTSGAPVVRVFCIL